MLFKCPLDQNYCARNGCAWWNDIEGACAVAIIAAKLNHLDELANNLADPSVGKIEGWKK